ncbi:DUF5634 family protein [Brevibacillus sp. NPDC058079]|uniref:DUF5634 family protein n=1 Tax=Brevibacillus sp. NPDC058079 TaxID=3346330 RepID=UPI0036EB23B8
MNFIAKETVMQDIENFANSIKSSYSVDGCTVFTRSEEDIVWMGYLIQKAGNQFIVKMPYVEDSGTMAIQKKQWTIEQDGREFAFGLGSLGEVFTRLEIEKS